MSILSFLGNKIISIIRNIGILLTWVAGIVLIVSAYSGFIDPEQTAIFAIIGLLFPVALIANVIFLLIWLICRKWVQALTVIACMAICFPYISTFSPININNDSLSTNDSTFKIISYNVMNFDDLEKNDNKEDNRTLRYILNQDADIVMLQEGSAKIKMDKLNLIKSLMPELEEKYPYRERRLRDLVILSKYPYTIDNEHIISKDAPKAIAYKINIDGKTLYLINVHLESIKLTDSDKELYREITDILNTPDKLNEQTVVDVKSTLLTKLANAFHKRAVQAKEIKHYIDSLGDTNIIICGDFNDTPSSYSYRTIMGDDMSDAYHQCAFGPAITFHTNRFYFRIDHVLYKGNIEAVNIERGNQKSSDHYPLLTTFKWK